MSMLTPAAAADLFRAAPARFLDTGAGIHATGMLVMLGVAAEISPIVVRLLGVGSVPREAMRWLLSREASDPQTMRDLLTRVGELVRDPNEQAGVIEAAEVTGELLALGAGARAAV